MTPLIRRTAILASLSLALVAVSSATASAPPVGPLPAGPTTTIQTTRGELVAVALPHRPGGRVWRIARPFDSGIVTEVREADVGGSVVVVFRARATGSTILRFGLTRGERATAYEARRFVIRVR
jgi:hypothetical protein